MALNYLFRYPVTKFHALFCVYSKSVLHALKNLDMKVRGELLAEISHIVYFLFLRTGAAVDFCWVLSRRVILDNGRADKLGKESALNSKDSEVKNIPLSLQEGYHFLEKKTLLEMIQRYI